MCLATDSARRLPRILPSLAVFLLPACGTLGLYDDRCGDESREVTADARILTAQSDSIGYAWVTLVESRGEERSRSIAWYVVSRSLRGHVGPARLVASEDTSLRLLPLPGAVGAEDVALEGDTMPYAEQQSFDELFVRARTGGFTLILPTDLPSVRVIALQLQLLMFGDWARPHCS